MAADRADESEDERKVDESDANLEEVDDVHNERLTRIADKAIAALEAPIEDNIDPGVRPRRRVAGWC